MSLKHTFSIEHKINPETKLPFGPKYAGNFVVHRPNIAENGQIAINYAALTSGRAVNPLMMDTSNAVNILYVFCHMAVIAEEKPKWFDANSMYEEDEPAVRAAHEEVELWLNSFRSKPSGEGSQQGSGQSAVLVQTKV